MNIIAMAFVSLGYAVFYWAANQIKHWNRSVYDTEAATMKILLGFPVDKNYETIHQIPFPFSTDTGGTMPSSNAGGNGLNPNFPGGPGATIPTPSIPGAAPSGGGFQPA